MKILFLTDLHFQDSKFSIVENFIIEFEKYIMNNNLDFVVIGGDLLHFHSKIYITSLNLATRLIKTILKYTKLFILIGNHDYINNQQFLTNKHWMNAFKKWENCNIIDKPTQIIYQTRDTQYKMCMIPYVPNGMMIKALNYIKDWKTSDFIFAHQEIKGCKFGIIKSIHGDIWEKTYPMLISGHIHDKQILNDNVIYPGDSINNKALLIEKINQNTTFDYIEIHKLEKKEILHVSVNDLINMQNINIDEKHIFCKDTIENIKNFKKYLTIPVEKINFIPIFNEKEEILNDINKFQNQSFLEIVKNKIDENEHKEKLIKILNEILSKLES